jgi:amino acid transporter
MNMLGEMTTYLPVRGVSVPYFINRFTEPSLGFAVGMCADNPDEEDGC